MHDAWLAMGIDCDGHIGFAGKNKTNVVISFSNNVKSFVDVYYERIKANGCVATRSQYDGKTSRQYTIQVTLPRGGDAVAGLENRLKFLELITPHLIRKEEIAQRAMCVIKESLDRRSETHFIYTVMDTHLAYTLEEVSKLAGISISAAYYNLTKGRREGKIEAARLGRSRALHYKVVS